MPLKKTEYNDDEIAIFDEAVIYKRGEYWQMRMWLAKCRVPDDWLLQNRRALLFGRDVLKAVMAAFTPGGQAA